MPKSGYKNPKKYYKDWNKKRSKAYSIYYANLRKSALDLLGNKCIRCGFDDPRALQFDHVNGGGVKEKKTMTKNYYLHVIGSLIKEEGKFQLLCANCNWIKRYENKEVRRNI